MPVRRHWRSRVRCPAAGGTVGRYRPTAKGSFASVAKAGKTGANNPVFRLLDAPNTSFSRAGGGDSSGVVALTAATNRIALAHSFDPERRGTLDASFSFVFAWSSSMQKQAIQQMLDELPDEVDVDQLLDRIILLEKIEEAERRLSAGEGVSHDEAKQRFEKWLK
jgi:hypothetical protein